MFSRLVILLLCICFRSISYGQQTNPIDIPVSLLTGQVEISRSEHKVANRKTGVKMLFVRQVQANNGHNDTSFPIHIVAFGKAGDVFPFTNGFDKDAFNGITYDGQGNVLTTNHFYSQTVGCGTNGYSNVSTHVYDRNVYKNDRLEQTIRKHFFYGAKVTRDTNQNEWSVTNYYYNSKGLKTRVASHYENLPENTAREATGTQYFYTDKGQLRAETSLYPLEDTLPPPAVAAIDDSLGLRIMRNKPEWRDSFLALQFGPRYYKGDYYPDDDDDEEYDDDRPVMSDTIDAQEERDDSLIDAYERKAEELVYYTYNANGTMARRVTIEDIGFNTHVIIDSFSYNKKKKITGWKTYDLYEPLKEWQFSYDKKGKVTEARLTTYQSNGFFTPPATGDSDTRTFKLSYTKPGLVNAVKVSQQNHEPSYTGTGLYIIDYDYWQK